MSDSHPAPPHNSNPVLLLGIALSVMCGLLVFVTVSMGSVSGSTAAVSVAAGCTAALLLIGLITAFRSLGAFRGLIICCTLASFVLISPLPLYARLVLGGLIGTAASYAWHASKGLR